MTVQEAIKYLQITKDCAEDESVGELQKQMCDMAIQALEKQIQKKPKEYEDKYYSCPVCGNILLHKWKKYPLVLMGRKDSLPFCLSCGQKLDWSELK